MSGHKVTGNSRVEAAAAVAEVDKEVCEKLAWDTDFWKVPVARVRLSRLTPDAARCVDQWCAEHGTACLYLLVDADDAETPRVAEGHGYHLVDVRVTYSVKLRQESIGEQVNSTHGLTIRASRTDDLDDLAQIARVSYRDTRFYFDGHFPHERCNDLYETWIRRSCEDFATTVLVAELDSHVTGYVTCTVLTADPHRGHIGLVGTSPSVRGRGVGHTLVSHALNWFATRDVPEVSVVTQGRNVAAQRLYVRSGFLPSDVQLWYHKWFQREEAMSGPDSHPI